jgi:Polysaccharide lyase
MENGTASAFRAKVKPALLFENGNHFVRITGSPGDNFSTGGHADRVRSEIPIGASRAAEGTIVTYSFSLRLGDNPPEAAVIMQLFQDGAGPVQGYAVAGDGTGPTVWITYSANEGLKMRNYFNDERDSQEVSLGQIPPDQFVHIDMTVHWSLTNEGWVATWVDGQLAGIMHGAPTNLSPNSHENVSMRVGTYGDGGAGSLDFDNIEIRYGGPNNGVCEP